jgi:hypothetical protein
MADHDRLERSLREPGPRERGYRPRALPASLAEARRERHAARPVLRAALVGAVAAGAAAVTLAITMGLPQEHVGVPGASSSAGSSAVASSAVASSSVGSGSASPSAQPTSDPSAPCATANLAVSADPWGGAMGSRGTTVLFRTVDSAEPCTLNGSPKTEIVDAAGNVLVSAAASNAGSPVQLGAGRVAELNIRWSNWCGADPPPPLKLVLHLEGASAEFPVTALGGGQMSAPPCNGPGQPSILQVLPFEASTRQFPAG